MGTSIITEWAVIIFFWIQCQNFNLKIEANFIKYYMRNGESGITVRKEGKAWGKQWENSGGGNRK